MNFEERENGRKLYIWKQLKLFEKSVKRKISFYLFSGQPTNES